MSNKLTEAQVEEIIYQNSLQTCHYISGYKGRRYPVNIKCEKHNYQFSTNFENLCRANRAHHVCPYCQQEDKDNKKIKYICDYCGVEYFIAPSRITKSEHHFCCREHKDLAQRIESGDKFIDLRPEHYNTTESNYRLKAFRHNEQCCAVCGWNEDKDVLEVHHIDENRQNNSLQNLIILCPTCHKKLTTHKYKLVNKEIIKM